MHDPQHRAEPDQPSAACVRVSVEERAQEAPRYGQAAAIYALYQFGFTKHDAKPKPPRKPRGGRLAGLLSGFAPLLRGLVPSEA